MKLFSGRINYPTYITGKIISWSLFFGIIFLLVFFYNITDRNLILTALLVSIPFGFIDSSLDARRAHDIGRSGAWAIFGFRNILWYAQMYKSSIVYAWKTRQWEFLFTTAPMDELTKQYGQDFPRWDWMYLDSENQPNQYGEKPKNGIDILGLFGL